MDSWHATFLGLRHLPREVTAFEIEVFFQFSAEEARIIEDRRRPGLKARACFADWVSAPAGSCWAASRDQPMSY
jgi:hypothetical protein